MHTLLSCRLREWKILWIAGTQNRGQGPESDSTEEKGGKVPVASVEGSSGPWKLWSRCSRCTEPSLSSLYMNLKLSSLLGRWPGGSGDLLYGCRDTKIPMPACIEPSHLISLSRYFSKGQAYKPSIQEAETGKSLRLRPVWNRSKTKLDFFLNLMKCWALWGKFKFAS